MKHIPAIKSVLSVVLFATLPALAQSPSPDEVSPLKLDLPQLDVAQPVRPQYRMGFDAPVSFKNLGGFPALSLAGKTPDGDPRNYDNGYVLPSGQGNPSPIQIIGDITARARFPQHDRQCRSSSAATVSTRTTITTHQCPALSSPNNWELVHKESWHGGWKGPLATPTCTSMMPGRYRPA